MRIIQLTDTSEGGTKILAFGCVLPDGQVAIAWEGKHKTHGCYRSFEAFEAHQKKIPNRAIENYKPSHTEYCFNLHPYGFHLLRIEDVTQVSGTGIVAQGCDFPGSGCILQWLSSPFGTFWYPNMDTIQELHGHDGKTKIEVNQPTSF